MSQGQSPATVGVSKTVGAVETGGKLEAMLNYQKQTEIDVLLRILVELRILTAYVAQGLNVRDEAQTYRNDPSMMN